MSNVEETRLTSRSQQRQHARDLVVHLVAREFQLRYQRSFLGWFWSLIQPLFRFLILYFVFARVLQLDIPNYALYLFTGLLGWLWFSSGLTSATSSALDRRELLLRPGIPRAAVPVVSVLTDGLDYLAALPVLAVILLVMGELHATALLLPLVVLPMIALMLGLGFLLCAANVHVRDVRVLVDLAMLLGFYITPIFYARSVMPESLAWVVDYNPMAWALDSQRRVVIDGVLPSPDTFVPLVVLSLALLVVGYAVYDRASRTFVDQL
jgi:lipopolysaccharide transport system permease protein